MTQEEARAAIQRLHVAFPSSTAQQIPRLIWSGRVKKGRADAKNNWIKIGPRCWRGPEYSLVHEYAHILAGRKRIRGHGPIFFQTLWAVAHEYFGDPRLYSWATEYRSIVARARRAGLLATKQNLTIKEPA